MSDRNRELADFLQRARSRVDPSRAGLPADDRVRRVPGLRREEVALLARVSTDYYTRLEQGRRIQPSPQVIDALAGALDLDEAGRAHLIDLIGTPGVPARRVPSVQRVRPGLRLLVDSLAEPAMVLGRRTDVLAANRIARALLVDWEAMPAKHRNYARWMFLDASARERLIDWDRQARAVVENLRLDVGRDPGDPAARALIDELVSASAEFRAWWEAHGVYQRTFGEKRFRPPVVGELAVQYETLTLPGDPDQVLFVYSTEAGSASREAMTLLASWAATGAGSEGEAHARPLFGERPELRAELG